MSEQDLKYLISSYQQKTFELFSQSIANEAKIRQLNDLIEALTAKVNEQKQEIEKLSQKTKRVSKNESDDFK